MAFLAVMNLYILSSAPLVRADNITSDVTIFAQSGADVSKLRDGNVDTRNSFAAKEELTITGYDIKSVYVIWHKIYGDWSITAGGHNIACGKNGYLHEYIELDDSYDELTLTLPDKATQICEIYLFSEGRLPNWVQVWNPPCEKADIMLLSTHSDDEQLFFAGVLPTYAGQRGLQVQVVYMTNHWDTNSRPHEQLDGLWTVGVKNYPIIGSFPDDPNTVNKKNEPVYDTLYRALAIYGRDELTNFQISMIDRFKPQVVIAHDVDGEYHHGAHMANTWSLRQALDKANWKIPKVYIHLWPENVITMNWDQPLSNFGGKTAFEISRQGFKCHKSQQWTWFSTWIAGKGINKASDIKQYSPCLYGLYRSNVGPDTGENDFMEHIVPYAEQSANGDGGVSSVPHPSTIPGLDGTFTATVSSKPDNKIGQLLSSGKFIAAIAVLGVSAVLIMFTVLRRKR